MSYRKFKIFLASIIILLIGFSLNAQVTKGVQRMPRAGMLSDVRATDIGDIVTILVVESSTANNTTSSATSNSNNLSATADFGGSFLKGLTGTISSQNANQFSGSGQVTSSGTFSVQLSARIIEVREDGNFLIRGSREISTNGEKVVTVVEGIVRPSDITGTNTILSTKISDARIFQETNGVAASSRKPGLFTRVINWIF